MAATIIRKESVDFLKKLAKNNTREWFNDHKELYTAAQTNMVEFAGDLLAEMNKHDQIETTSGKQSLFRIYKDVRFSKEKVPYNNHWSGSFKRATNKLRGGYYFHIQPGGSFLAGGSVEEAREIIKLGFYLGIGGVATYKNSGLKEVLPQIGLSNVVFETDAPYLTPVPHRGKRNEPAYIKLICEEVAKIMGMSYSAVAETTTQNALKVFNV